MISQRTQETIDNYLTTFRFLKGLEEALTIFFSKQQYIKWSKSCPMEVYKLQLVTIVVRDTFDIRKGPKVLLFAQSELVHDKENGLFMSSSVNEISDTDFYSELIDIPEDCRHSIAHGDKFYLTHNMRKLIKEKFQPNKEQCATENTGDWMKIKFNTRTQFFIP
ncbi:MAG: hypothetical protein KA007_03505 [Candidatus Pacebacteria bacterium]|nr:hypothetical protein [Candidatus Paceibacterota bacterium]